MARLGVFAEISADGYFVDEHGDMSWAHGKAPDDEWSEFVEGNASGDSILLFGRVTYQLMESYWPTPHAAVNNPSIAARMNSLLKIVFSRTLEEAGWKNTTLVKVGLLEKIRELKDGDGPDLVTLGSGQIVSQLAEAGLVDEFQFVVSPVVLGRGRSLFEGVTRKLPLSLRKTRAFKNGNVVLWYEPSTA
jgi:dihydrofolate reductase